VWKKLFFHLLDLALVNAQILQWEVCTNKFRLYKFIEKVAKGHVAEVLRELLEQSQKCSVGHNNGQW
jgi:hypothetical protein